MMMSLLGSQRGVEVGRVGRGYLLGGRVELFWFDNACFNTAMATFSSSAMTTTISTTTFNSPPPGIYFEATNQAETHNNVSTDSVQMRIIDFFPFFLHEQPMHRFTTFPFHLTLIFLSSMPSRPYVRSRLLKAHAIAYCLLKASTIF